MPQMAPLWWDILFIYFLMVFLMINMLIYFNKNYKPLTNMMKKSINSMKWKW
uniref:ATP synthase complex subunit 8 n=1 Tax=Anacestra spiniger TaxID=2813426 RepID=A0A8T9ZXX7_9HEMI|nr:ATPase subunit 8 [Anacestra spiniger]